MTSWNTSVKHVSAEITTVRGVSYVNTAATDQAGNDSIDTVQTKAATESAAQQQQQQQPHDTNGHANGTAHAQQASSLDMRNIRYSVQVRYGQWWKGACLRQKHTRVILNDVTLRVKSGEITAVLGNSGKTTLVCRQTGATQIRRLYATVTYDVHCYTSFPHVQLPRYQQTQCYTHRVTYKNARFFATFNVKLLVSASAQMSTDINGPATTTRSCCHSDIIYFTSYRHVRHASTREQLPHKCDINHSNGAV